MAKEPTSGSQQSAERNSSTPQPRSTHMNPLGAPSWRPHWPKPRRMLPQANSLQSPRQLA